jgi:hypothetical protein
MVVGSGMAASGRLHAKADARRSKSAGRYPAIASGKALAIRMAIAARRLSGRSESARRERAYCSQPTSRVPDGGNAAAAIRNGNVRGEGEELAAIRRHANSARRPDRKAIQGCGPESMWVKVFLEAATAIGLRRTLARRRSQGIAPTIANGAKATEDLERVREYGAECANRETLDKDRRRFGMG